MSQRVEPSAKDHSCLFPDCRPAAQPTVADVQVLLERLGRDNPFRITDLARKS